MSLPTKDKDGTEQITYYDPGVGTTFGSKWKGGIFGYGIDELVCNGYAWLMENYVKDDEVFIFGFSRGAFAARSLSGLVSRCGLAIAEARSLWDNCIEDTKRIPNPNTIPSPFANLRTTKIKGEQILALKKFGC
ncbi:MAG: DUF2235 domain-containing protein [Methylovirgula sp.]